MRALSAQSLYYRSRYVYDNGSCMPVTWQRDTGNAVDDLSGYNQGVPVGDGTRETRLGGILSADIRV